MRKKLLIFGAAMMVLAVAVSLGFAFPRGGGKGGQFRGGHGGPHGFGIERIANDLGLSDEQKSAIDQIVAEERTASESTHEQMRAIMEELRLLGTDGQFDEAKVRALASQQAPIMIEQLVSRERAKAKVFSVLTPEQRAAALERMEQFGGKGRGPRR